MKQLNLFLFLILTVHISAQDSFISIDKALEISKTEAKPIMLVFSGSDWCKPCIELKKNILETNQFAEIKKELILLYLDFPYKKSNRLSKEETKHNEQLAEMYNPHGHFPKVLILNSEGDVDTEILYKKNMKEEDFIQHLKKAL